MFFSSAVNPGCDPGWSATAPSPLSDTTALRFAYSGTLSVPGGGTSSFSVSFDVTTPAAIDGRIAWNSAGANASAGGSSVGAAESTRVGLKADGQPTIIKTASQHTYDAVGDTVTFTYLVGNVSGVTVTNVTVVDVFTDAASGSAAGAVTCVTLSNPADACSGATTTLLPQQQAFFQMTYSITQADLDHGLITDVATVTAQPALGPALSNISDPVTVTAVQSPALTLVKDVAPTNVSAAGVVVGYTFDVTNTGNVTLTSIGVSELAFGGSGGTPLATCPAGDLAPTASVTCTASYTITQADIDSGAISNIALATGDDPAGASIPTPPTSDVTVPVVYAPALTLVKTADATHVTRPGTVIHYSFQVINNGNTTLTGLTVSETAFSGAGALGAVTCPVTTLAPTDRTTCTADYTVDAGDAGSRRITNTAEASAAYNRAGAAVTVTSAASTAVVAVDPVLGLATTGSDMPLHAAGVAAVAVALGALLVAATRRRRSA